MNQLTVALKDAGIKLPSVRRRVWNWLKDHPEKTYLEVAAGLNIANTTAGQTLCDMKKRGMVTVYRDPIKHRSKHGPTMIQRFSVKHKDYELLPYMTFIPQKLQSVPTTVTVVPSIPRVEMHKEATPKKDLQQAKPKLRDDEDFLIDRMIEDLTVWQAKIVYLKLKEVFDGDQ